jgi:hypothetical protein
MSEITLPDLPDLWASAHAPRFCLWTVDDMRAYATAAVEADRAARGEPVAWANNDEPPMLFWDKTEALKHSDSEADLVPLYAHPPAAPAELTDERIDYIAELVVRSMPEGISGFLKAWGWRQFARALLQDCAGHVAADRESAWQPIETAPEYESVLACNALGYVGRACLRRGRWEHIGKPTHWMPLPAAPSQPEGEK